MAVEVMKLKTLEDVPIQTQNYRYPRPTPTNHICFLLDRTVAVDVHVDKTLADSTE